MQRHSINDIWRVLQRLGIAYNGLYFSDFMDCYRSTEDFYYEFVVQPQEESISSLFITCQKLTVINMSLGSVGDYVEAKEDFIAIWGDCGT